jgi:hypothetical protein
MNKTSTHKGTEQSTEQNKNKKKNGDTLAQATKIAAVVLAALVVAVVLGIGIKNAFVSASTPWKVQSSADWNHPAAGAGGAPGSEGSAGVQDVTLTLDSNYDYLLMPSTLKKGVPVRMTVDMDKVVGCAASIVIPDFGVRKLVSRADNVITFTPDKTGAFVIHCSMNMYRGTFQVTDDGTPSASLQEAQAKAAAAPSSGGSCGAGGGGCGCGMKRRT